MKSKNLRGGLRRRGATVVFAGVMTAFAGAALAASLMNYIYQTESGGNANATNSMGSARGVAGMTNVALQQIGWRNENGTWTAAAAAHGVTSDATYMGNAPAQRASAVSLQQNNWGSMQGAYSQYNGQTVNGVAVNASSTLYCAHVLGPGGCRQWLRDGTFSQAAIRSNPGIQGWFGRKMAGAADTDSAELTGVAGTTGNSGTGTVTMPDGSTESRAVIEGLYCDPAILDMQNQNGAATVDAAVALAGNGTTGYTLLGGDGIFDAAGLGALGDGGIKSSIGGAGSFRQMSCLDRLMSSSLDILFSPPNLSSILGLLENAICQQASRLFAQVTQPVSQMLNKSSSINLGGFAPGLGLGSISTGVNGRVTPGGGSNGSFVNSNLGQVMSGDASWYKVGTPMQRPGSIFNGMFGQQGSQW